MLFRSVCRFVRQVRVVSAALFLISGLPVLAQGYHITDRWKVEGNPRWDYLTDDAANHVLYLTQGTQLTVIDTQTGKTISVIGNLKGIHGVVLDAIDKYGYVTDGGANAVVVFDRHTYATVMSIPVGDHPDGMVYEPVTKTAWAFNGGSKDATVIDTTTNKVVATIKLPGRPEFPVADGKGMVFDNIEDKNAIVRLDAKSKTLTATWPVSCDGPSGLAMDTEHRRLFAVCDGNKMAVVDADTGKTVATPAIGDGPDAARFDAKRQVALSSNGGGTLTVVHEDGPDQYSVVQNLETQKSARTLALDEATGKIYLAAAEFGPRPEKATPENPRRWPTAVPGSFVILVVSP
jgi:YVTN family beta-propeller protein